MYYFSKSRTFPRVPDEPYQILFVCMGNICRSPAAEIIFRHRVNEAGLRKYFDIDSAGTTNYQQGNPPDPRMARVLQKRDYSVCGTARKIRHQDLEDSQLILVMDRENREDLLVEDADGKNRHKIRYLTDFCKKLQATHVPDPYCGSAQDFENVADLIEDACDGLLEFLKKDLESP